MKNFLQHCVSKHILVRERMCSVFWEPNNSSVWLQDSHGYEIPTLGDGDSGEVPEGQDCSPVSPRNFQPSEQGVRGPSAAGWGCWAGASWPVILSFHTVMFCFDTTVTIKKKKRKVIDYSRIHANLPCYFSKLICAWHIPVGCQWLPWNFTGNGTAYIWSEGSLRLPANFCSLSDYFI